MDKQKNFAKNSSIVFTLTTFGSALNYLCQILMGRFFSVSNYGIVNAIFSLTVIVSVIGSTASMILSKIISENRKSSSNLCYKILSVVNSVCIVLLLGSIILSPLFVHILNWNYLTVILAIISLVTSIYPIVYQGIFGGLGKFISLGLYTLIIPIIKILSLVLIVLLNISGINEIYSILLAIIFGNVISLIVGYIITKSHIKETKKSTKKIRYIWQEYKNVFYANILIMFLMNIDILYLTFFYDSETIGLYSSVLVFGKMIYYFVTALVTVMLPLISKNKKDSKYVSKMLYKTLTYTIILTIIFLIPTNIFGKNILNLIFGSKYDSAIIYLKYASLISLSYSLNLILLNYLTGINKVKLLKKTLMIGSILAVIILTIMNSYKYISLIIIFLINISIFIINLLAIKNRNLGG